MSSDSEKLPKPNKRRRQILSDSDSSTDDSFINTHRHTKRKVGRVISEGDTSDEDSDVPSRSVQKRKNHKLPSEDETIYQYSFSVDASCLHFDRGSTSSEWQSDWESEEIGIADIEPDRHRECKCTDVKIKPLVKKSSGSESSDSESEHCPICLLSFRKQQVGNPSSCEHCFCLECIVEWSKNINTCPVDRQTFDVINVRAKIGGKIIKHVPVQTEAHQQEVQEDSTFCEVCQQCDREDRMLLCDGCDSGYHLECLDPPLDEIPLEEHWYCPECARNSQNDAEAIEIDLDEVPDLMEEARQLGLSYGRSRAQIIASRIRNELTSPARQRAVPRTRQVERVRANIAADRRRRAAAVLAQQQIATSSGFDSIGENSRGGARSPVPGPSTSRSDRVAPSRTRRKPTKKKKIVRRSRQTVTADPYGSTPDDHFREVRITEVNASGELEELVTYVRTLPDDGPSGRKRKRRKVRRLSDYED